MKTYFKKIFFPVFSLLVMFNLNACKKDPIDPVDINDVIKENAVVLMEETLGDHRLLVYTEAALKVGHNNIYFRLVNAEGNPTDDYTVMTMPMMDMGMMQHSTPFANPTKVDGQPGVKMGHVTFIMPSTGGEWSVDFTINIHSESYELMYMPTVIAPEKSRLLNILDERDGLTRVFVSLKEPVNPTVGENHFELGVFKRENMMSYPAIDDLQISIEPWMPSMNHGSMNNVNPIQMEDGFYHGEANFSMTGDWQVIVNLKDANGAVIADSLVFEFLLQ